MFQNLVQKVDRLFLLLVALPTFAAILYFGVFASDVYISESRFVVRSPDKPSSSGLGVLLKSAGFSNAGDEIFAAHDYVLSRDALRELNRNQAVRTIYASDKVSIFDRFGGPFQRDSFEHLYKYYLKKVSVDYDTSSSITTLSVQAFTPADAERMNSELLKQAEVLVNRLNVRGRQDLISYAQSEVDEAKEKSRTAALALSAYRNTEGVVDPEKQATVQLQMISKLQDELIAARTQLLQLQVFTPDNPQIPVLRTRIKGLGREIDEQSGMVAGGRKSLAAATAQYQRLQLEATFADRQLAAALTSLQDARNEARRKQAYVETIVRPSLPDYPLEPRRLRGMLSTLVLGLVAWGISRMLLAGVREHRE
jgi:capsular polysaccharide transport system permease protein